MRTVAGIFNMREDAERAVKQLREIGLSDKEISILAPGVSKGSVESTIEISDTEQPGVGSAIGGVVGGALGAAGGATMGAAIASLMVPGVGPVLAAGLIGAALLGAGGAAVGASAAGALEDTIEGLPHDELFIYEDALRKGRTVVIVMPHDETESDTARTVLAQAGAESVDAAREAWWVGLRDAEAEHYTIPGRDVAIEESLFRKGFEAALHSLSRGRSFEERLGFLQKYHSGDIASEAFKRGYERGQNYQREQQEKHLG